MIYRTGDLWYPYAVSIDNVFTDHRYIIIDEWCERTWKYDSRWQKTASGWQFKCHEDAVLVELTWG